MDCLLLQAGTALGSSWYRYCCDAAFSTDRLAVEEGEVAVTAMRWQKLSDVTAE